MKFVITFLFALLSFRAIAASDLGKCYSDLGGTKYNQICSKYTTEVQCNGSGHNVSSSRGDGNACSWSSDGSVSSSTRSERGEQSAPMSCKEYNKKCVTKRTVQCKVPPCPTFSSLSDSQECKEVKETCEDENQIAINPLKDCSIKPGSERATCGDDVYVIKRKPVASGDCSHCDTPRGSIANTLGEFFGDRDTRTLGEHRRVLDKRIKENSSQDSTGDSGRGRSK